MFWLNSHEKCKYILYVNCYEKTCFILICNFISKIWNENLEIWNFWLILIFSPVHASIFVICHFGPLFPLWSLLGPYFIKYCLVLRRPGPRCVTSITFLKIFCPKRFRPIWSFSKGFTSEK